MDGRSEIDGHRTEILPQCIDETADRFAVHLLVVLNAVNRLEKSPRAHLRLVDFLMTASAAEC